MSAADDELPAESSVDVVSAGDVAPGSETGGVSALDSPGKSAAGVSVDTAVVGSPLGWGIAGAMSTMSSGAPAAAAPALDAPALGAPALDAPALDAPALTPSGASVAKAPDALADEAAADEVLVAACPIANVAGDVPASSGVPEDVGEWSMEDPFDTVVGAGSAVALPPPAITVIAMPRPAAAEKPLRVTRREMGM